MNWLSWNQGINHKTQWFELLVIVWNDCAIAWCAPRKVEWFTSCEKFHLGTVFYLLAKQGLTQWEKMLPIWRLLSSGTLLKCRYKKRTKSICTWLHDIHIWWPYRNHVPLSVISPAICVCGEPHLKSYSKSYNKRWSFSAGTLVYFMLKGIFPHSGPNTNSKLRKPLFNIRQPIIVRQIHVT